MLSKPLVWFQSDSSSCTSPPYTTGLVQKIVTDMQAPGALDAIQEEVKNNMIEEAKAKGAPPEVDEAKLKSEAQKVFLRKYKDDILKVKRQCRLTDTGLTPCVESAWCFNSLKVHHFQANGFKLTQPAPPYIKAFPKMGKAIINAEDDEERGEVLEDAMEARLNKIETEFNKQTAILKEELGVYKIDMLKELTKIMDEVGRCSLSNSV